MKEGCSNILDRRFSYLADMKISIPALKALAEEYLSYILPLKSMTKKCIVLDLDNTLWGGIVGEVGLEKIKLGPDKEGKPFLDFQKRLLELFEKGVILAINSKNNPGDVMEVLNKHKYMILKEDNFACIKINWQDKATNMVNIAKELNIGLDSLVFLDDDPSNRELIRKFLPEVLVIDLPEDPSLYCEILEKLNVFNIFSTTKEDLERGKMYIDEKKRNLLKESLRDLKEFIKELKIECIIEDNKKEEAPRISQLTQKTNQFNLTTKRYSEEEIKRFMESKNYMVSSIQVKDKFGDYGLTGVVIINKKDKEWDIDSYLLSCRILGREIEFTFINHILLEAKKNNVNLINARFIPTKKNMPAKNFLKEAGFALVKEEEGASYYSLNLNNQG